MVHIPCSPTQQQNCAIAPQAAAKSGAGPYSLSVSSQLAGRCQMRSATFKYHSLDHVTCQPPPKLAIPVAPCPASRHVAASLAQLTQVSTRHCLLVITLSLWFVLSPEAARYSYEVGKPAAVEHYTRVRHVRNTLLSLHTHTTHTLTPTLPLRVSTHSQHPQDVDRVVGRSCTVRQHKNLQPQHAWAAAPGTGALSLGNGSYHI